MYPNYNFSQQNVYAFVNGIEGAKAYQVMPNQTVLLVDSESSLLYVKQANAIGQATMQTFELKQVVEKPAPTYVTREELEQMIKELKHESNIKNVEPTKQQ